MTLNEQRRGFIKAILALYNRTQEEQMYFNELIEIITSAADQFDFKLRPMNGVPIYNHLRGVLSIEIEHNKMNTMDMDFRLDVFKDDTSRRGHILELETLEYSMDFWTTTRIKISYKNRHKIDPLKPSIVELLTFCKGFSKCEPRYLEYRTQEGRMYSTYLKGSRLTIDNFHSLPRSLKAFEYSMRTGEVYEL